MARNRHHLTLGGPGGRTVDSRSTSGLPLETWGLISEVGSQCKLILTLHWERLSFDWWHFDISWDELRHSNSGIDESDPHSETDTEYAVLTMFIFIPSQGFFVSLLLCLTNAEVRLTKLGEAWGRWGWVITTFDIFWSTYDWKHHKNYKCFPSHSLIVNH